MGVRVLQPTDLEGAVDLALAELAAQERRRGDALLVPLSGPDLGICQHQGGPFADRDLVSQLMERGLVRFVRMMPRMFARFAGRWWPATPERYVVALTDIGRTRATGGFTTSA